MKNQWWFGLIALLFLYAIPSNAACGMYTYQDMWMDANGNALGENFTQVTGCYGTSTYSAVHLTMPSGYQIAASATGSTTAEALAQSSVLSQSGDGLLSGYSEVFSDVCDYFDSFSFSRLFSIGESFTWFRFASGTTFSKMQPCPEPGHTITCTRDTASFGDPNDIHGVFLEIGQPWLRFFGLTLCSPFAYTQGWQNTDPGRPYCYDLP